MVIRLGRKNPKDYIPFFPANINTFIDLFMGSGALTFAMAKKCKEVFANDIDDDIFNLYQVVTNRKYELLEAIENMPESESLFKFWKSHEEQEPIQKALRFMFLSNFSYLGKKTTFLCIPGSNPKRCTLNRIKKTFFAQNIKFTISDFRHVIRKISFGGGLRQKNNAFIYADPPYMGTANNYSHGFTEDDSKDLFEILVGSGLRFAMSEFQHPFILEMAEQYGLRITEVKERRNLQNRKVEILVTNYEVEKVQPELL